MAHHDSKILNHQDREELIKQLLDGNSASSVVQWLKDKYPDNKNNHISLATITKFRTEYLNLDQEAARLIKKERRKQQFGLPHNPNINAFIEKTGESEKEHLARVKNTLFNSPTYCERIKQITDAQLDTPRLMKELQALLTSRIEQYYNKINLAGNELDVKEDRMFLEYVRLASEVVKDSTKVWNDYNSQPDEGIIDLNIVQELVGTVRDVVRELLGELDPGLALEFMDRLNIRLSNTQYQPPIVPNIIERVEKMNSRIREIQERDDDKKKKDN